MPFRDQLFDLVVFDPSHLIRLGDRSYMNIKYSKLDEDTWQDDLKKASMSAGVCSRVTAP